jgi:hypothetical protein
MTIMKTLPLSLVFAGLALSLAAAPDSVTGTWRWKLTMPDGSEVQPRLKLKQEGSELTGTSALRAGTETAITNGSVKGDEIRFEVVRERNGAAAVTRYSGKREFDVIRGKVESNWSGEFTAYDWEARRASGIDGPWKWTNWFGDRPFESRVTLKLEGEKLTGSVPGFRGGRSSTITNGTFKEGEIYFEVERRRDDSRSVTKHIGTLEGETIVGTIESTFGGTPRTNDWDAVRAD